VDGIGCGSPDKERQRAVEPVPGPYAEEEVMDILYEMDDYLRQFRTGVPMTCYHPTVLVQEAKSAILYANARAEALEDALDRVK